MTYFVATNREMYDWVRDKKTIKPVSINSMDELRKRSPHLMYEKNYQNRYGYLVVWEGKTFNSSKSYKYAIMYSDMSTKSPNPYELTCRGIDPTDGGFGEVIWRIALRPMYITSATKNWRELK